MTEWISVKNRHPHISTENDKHFVFVFFDDGLGYCNGTNAMYFHDESDDSYCWKTYCVTEREGYFHNITGVQYWCEIPGWIVGDENLEKNRILDSILLTHPTPQAILDMFTPFENRTFYPSEPRND